MAPARTWRGGPLLALCAILGFWVAGRAAVLAYGEPDVPAALGEARMVAEVGRTHAHALRAAAPSVALGAIDPPVREPAPALPRLAPAAGPNPVPFAPPPRRPGTAFRTNPLPPRVAAGHNLLWMAALSRMPLPAGFGVGPRGPEARPAPFYPVTGFADRARRWSADGWLLLRRGAGEALATGAAPASYGASQAGAVLRYRLAPSNAHRPEAYVRVSEALDGPSQREAAAGLSARPLASVPVRAMVELRLSDQGGSIRPRPAAFVVTELSPIDLPRGARAEFYGQAGYVGGRYATVFADGQARVDRQVAQIGKGVLRAGGGAWAGAQKGAARLDIGPTASLGLPVGDAASARLWLDWRLRIAGEARPGSGIALTLSAGF